MDENDFFRQATLRICGNLDIEKSLYSTLQFLRQVMPVDGMVLQYYDRGMHSVSDIALVTQDGATLNDMTLPISVESREQLIREFPIEFGKAFLIENPEKYQFFQELSQTRDSHPTSMMVLVLDSGTDRLCSLVLGTEGDEQFTQKHVDLLSLLSEPFAIATANTLKHKEILQLKDMLTDDNRYLHGELRRMSGDKIVGANFGLKEVMHKVQRVTSLDSPVLLLGETGVGKDVIANIIHYSSPRSSGPFVSVNCGAIPETLIDSELFGHEKGSFTGALSQKRGRFERADKGTIFLDEIGELPLQAQVRFLNVLQAKEIERIGGTKTIPLDIRIIAATNRDLEEMVKTHHFREDLWFRLNIFPILIPPLRERKADIPALLQHFVAMKAKELKLPSIPILSEDAIAPLLDYHWPGNVRELENVVERALILNPEGPLAFDHLQFSQQMKVQKSIDPTEESDNLDKIIARHIRQVLNKTKGKLNGPDGAAALLGIHPSTLRHRLRKLNIGFGRKSSWEQGI